MTSQDYIAFAKLAKDTQPITCPKRNKQWEEMVAGMILIFQRDNPEFDSVRFWSAVGIIKAA